MKVCIALFLVVVSTYSCKTVVTPVKGTYPDTPMIFSSEKSFDAVWDNIIDLFAQKGLSIKIINRSSGLITSDKALIPVTFELKVGGLKDPGAFVVTSKYYDRVLRKTLPITGVGDVFGGWNIRIKRAGSGTSINVNLVNVTYMTLDATVNTSTSRLNQKELRLQVYKSTGVFEKIIADAIR